MSDLAITVSGESAPIVDDAESFDLTSDLQSPSIGLRGMAAANATYQPLSTALAQPGPLDASRWPEVDEAVIYAKAATTEWRVWQNPTTDGHACRERLNDLLFNIPDMDKKLILRRLDEYLEQSKVLKNRTYGDGVPPVVGQEGWTDQDWEAAEKARTEEVETRRLKAEASRDAALAAVHTMLSFPANLPNPCIVGRTWLVSWPVLRTQRREGEESTGLDTWAALVIAPAGLALKEGDQFYVCKAGDRDKSEDEIDRPYVTVKAIPVLLSRQQCEAWGHGMHWKGRALYALLPDPKDEKPKHGTRKKANLEALESEMNELIEEVKGLEAELGELLRLDPRDPKIPGIHASITKKNERIGAIRSQR